MASGEEEDYWTGAALTGAAGVAADQPPALAVQTIEGVEPLDAQFGVAEPLTVPAALRDALFGQPELIEGRAILPLQTYAILDAAKVMGLPEMLDASGLEHACLFKGEAAEELRDVAPYLVRLDEASIFTRNLFTKGDAGWHMWDKEPGIYLRSYGTIEYLWQHFRRFTRVRDEAGKWFYFRFWEADCLIDYMRFVQENDRTEVHSLLGFDPNLPSRPLIQTYISLTQSVAKTCSVSAVSGHNEGAYARIDMSIVRFLALRSHAHGFAKSFYDAQDAGVSIQQFQRAKEVAAQIVWKYHAQGFKSRYHLGSFTYWALALGSDFEIRTPNMKDYIYRPDMNSNDRFVLMAREIKRVFGPGIRNYRGHGT